MESKFPLRSFRGTSWRKKGGRREGYHGKAVSTLSVCSLEGICGFFDLFVW